MRVIVPLLQRYVFGELLRVLALVLLCLTVLLVFIGVFQQASESGFGPMQLLEVMPYIVPSMLPFTIPAALLLTVSLVYGRLAGDLEMTAAKAAGVSVTTMLWPSFIIGAGLSACCLVLTDQAIPWAMSNIQQTAVAAMEDILLDRLRTERQYTDRQHGLHVAVADVQGRTLIQPVFTVLHGDRTESLCAEEATIHLNLERQEVEVHLKNGQIELENQSRIYIDDPRPWAISWRSGKSSFNPRQAPIRLISQELEAARAERTREQDRMLIEAAFALTTGDFDTLTDPKSKHRQLLKDCEKRTWRMSTEVHSRYALACSCLFFVLVGSPLAVLKAQSKFLASFLYCFVPIVTGYYPLVLGMMAQAKKGHINPMWAMWVGNAILALVGLWLLRRVARH
ncbi:MAG: LptF/LptG family permease [Planctomycetaceae bacterium]|nr:LptF/LptG family permease [Planctomycetaceae bacterium]